MKRMIIAVFFSIFLLSGLVYADTFFDDFNDNQLDTSNWEMFNGSEKNGVFNIDFPPMSTWVNLTSRASFHGDFECRMEWKNWTFSGYEGPFQNPPQDVAQIGWEVHPANDPNIDNINKAFIYQFRGWFPENDLGDRYVSNYFANNVIQGSGTFPESTPDDTNGFFGIERVGSTIRTYYSDTNYPSFADWNLHGEFNNAFTDPVRLMLRGYTGDHTNSFHAEWDNVSVVADLITFPPPPPPPSEMNCDIPYLKDWGFGSYYDGRFATDDFPFPHPAGGWKFSVTFDLHDENGNEVKDKIKKIVFRNLDTNLRIKLGRGSAWISEFLGAIEYSVWLGHKSNVIGNWEMTVVMKGCPKQKYTRTWEVTEAMMDLPRPEPVTNIAVTAVEGGIEVTHDAVLGPPNWPNATYRFRVYESGGDFIYQDRDSNSVYDQATNTLTWFVPNTECPDCIGKPARIETRIYLPVPDELPWFCSPWSHEMNRVCKHFILE